MDGDNLMRLMKKIAIEQLYPTDNIQIKPISSGGANYSSKLYHIKISGDGKDLRLFAKVACPSETLRGQVKMEPYNTERLVYNELLKVYRKLEENHGVTEEHRLKFPKYYGSDATQWQETLVLENLTSKGFGPANRFVSVDWEYAAAAITECAKFHALSIAYQHERPSDFEKTLSKFTSGMFTDNEDTQTFFNGSVKSALEAVREENKERLKSFLARYNVLSYGDSFQALRRQVIGHLDFRPNNMLHRVKEDGTTEVIPVDYQTVQGGCPVLDLLYFIFTATDGQFRAKYYQQMVDHYYSELSAALARLGLRAEEEYPRDDFEFDMKEKLYAGLLVSVIILPTLTVPEDHAPSLDDGKLTMSNFVVQKMGPQYPKRLNEVVDDFVSWGIL